MSFFDIERFYQQYKVDYITKGVNVKSGEINISCPFCNKSGNADPSYHLGVDSSKGYYSCWRNSEHRGKSLHRLIMTIARCSYEAACELLGNKIVRIDNGYFDEFMNNPDTFFDEVIEIKKSLFLDVNFKEFGKSEIENPYLNYLSNRGFENVLDFCKLYDLRYCRVGSYRNRVILPIYYKNELVSWTGRHIGETDLRYLSLSEKSGAKLSIKDMIFNFDYLSEVKKDILFVTEGPFDSLKLDYYGYDYGVAATCLFNKILRNTQISLLNKISDNFKKIVILLDSDELESNLKVLGALNFLGKKVELGTMLEGYKDPGELDKAGVLKLIKLNKGN